MTSAAPTAGYVASPWRTYVRRGAVPVVLGIILGVLLGAALLVVSPKEYTAASRVLVTDTGLNDTANSANGRTAGTINLDTEAQLVTSAAVVHLAGQSDPGMTQRYTYSKLVSRISVTVPANTTVLQIAYTDRTARDAFLGANALAAAYLTDRQSTAQNQLNQQIDKAQSAADTLSTRLQSLITKSAGLASNSTQRSVVDSQISFVKAKIGAIDQNIVALQNIQITPGRILSPASMPQHPSSPSKTLYLASGFAVGLLIGLFAAWLSIRFRRMVRSVDDLAHIVDAPCVAVFQRADPTVVGALSAYRHLTVVVSAVVQPPARIAVTSPQVTSECGYVATGLAAALTRHGSAAAVLQVHGDEVSTPKLPGVPVVRVLDADEVITAGDRSLPAALDRIRGERDVLVIDVPGATITADAQVMGAEADAVLLVVTARTRTRRVREAVAGLDSVGAPLLGTVLVREPERAPHTEKKPPKIRPARDEPEEPDARQKPADAGRQKNNGAAGQRAAAPQRSPGR